MLLIVPFRNRIYPTPPPPSLSALILPHTPFQDNNNYIVLDPARLAEEQRSTTPPALVTCEPIALVK